MQAIPANSEVSVVSYPASSLSLCLTLPLSNLIWTSGAKSTTSLQVQVLLDLQQGYASTNTAEFEKMVSKDAFDTPVLLNIMFRHRAHCGLEIIFPGDSRAAALDPRPSSQDRIKKTEIQNSKCGFYSTAMSLLHSYKDENH